MPTIKLLGLVSGDPTEFDGQYLVDYDPRPLVDKDGEEGEFIHLDTTTDPAKARLFCSVEEAYLFYRSPSGRLRADGEKDRPLTAFHAEIG
jgi:hypothetical protein